MKGKPLAERIRARVAGEVAEIGRIGLVTVLVGDDPASDVYIRLKHKAATEAGFVATDLRLPAETPEDELLAQAGRAERLAGGRRDPRPAPAPGAHRRGKAIRSVAPAKDVDGFHPLNAGELYLGRPALVPATPRGVLALLAEHGVELEGANAVVVGRSQIVGKPMAHLLLQANATVTVCHSRTRDLAQHTRAADVLVVAVGVPGSSRPKWSRRRGRGRCRDEPLGRRPRRRCRSRGPPTCLRDYTRTGRRRPDDHRLPPRECRAMRPLSPR